MYGFELRESLTDTSAGEYLDPLDATGQSDSSSLTTISSDYRSRSGALYLQLDEELTPRLHAMMECDTLLMIGSGFPYSEFFPKEGHARGVQIDIAPDMLSLRYPMEVNLVGDAAETLRGLIPLLTRKDDRGWLHSDDRGKSSHSIMENRQSAED